MTAILENLQDHAHGLPVKNLRPPLQSLHNGHLYEIFKRGEQDAEFISQCAESGLEDEAISFPIIKLSLRGFFIKNLGGSKVVESELWISDF